MRETTRRRLARAGVGAAAAGLLALGALAADSPTAARYHALAVNMSDVGRSGANGVDITIERWSTDDEQSRLVSALTEKGSDGLMKELQKIKPRAGHIRRTGGGIGWNIQYARRLDLPEGGSRVVFVTDRPMSFQEAAARPRSAEYEFMVAELRIGPDGKGEGKLVPMAKVSYDKNRRVIEVENYANEPVRLSAVTEEKPKTD